MNDQQQQYPKEQTDFLQAVWDMREAQNQYFAQQSNYRLRTAKHLEFKVDQLLAKWKAAGAIKDKSTVTQQTLL